MAWLCGHDANTIYLILCTNQWVIDKLKICNGFDIYTVQTSWRVCLDFSIKYVTEWPEKFESKIPLLPKESSCVVKLFWIKCSKLDNFIMKVKYRFNCWTSHVNVRKFFEVYVPESFFFFTSRNFISSLCVLFVWRQFNQLTKYIVSKVFAFNFDYF